MKKMILLLIITIIVIFGCSKTFSKVSDSTEVKIAIIPESYTALTEYYFSSNGKNVAYTGGTREKPFIVKNNIPEKYYGYFLNYDGSLFKFSPDGERFAYVVEGKTGFVVIDGKEGPRYDDTYLYATRPHFSPNSRDVLYVAKKENNEFLVLNGNEGKRHRIILDDPIFSPDSLHIAYNADGVIVLDNKEFKISGGIETSDISSVHQSIFFSPDSKKLAFIKGRQPSKNNSVILLDVVTGQMQEGPIFQGIRLPITFSPDSKKIGYAGYEVSNTVNEFAVIDGIRGKSYSRIRAIAFSNDGKHSAYGAITHSHDCILVIDDVEVKKYNQCFFEWTDYDVTFKDLKFSPAGDKIAYTVNKMGRIRGRDRVGQAVDEYDLNSKLVKEGIVYEYVYSPYFIDDRYLVFIAQNDEKYFVVVNSKEKKRYEGIGYIHQAPINSNGRILFSADGKTISYGAKLGYDLIWVTEPLNST